MHKSDKPIGVAVLGLGNVGREVVRIIEESAGDLAARIGAPLELRGVAVRSVSGDRGVPESMLTDDVEGLVSRDDVDIVVELNHPMAAGTPAPVPDTGGPAAPAPSSTVPGSPPAPATPNAVSPPPASP